MYLSVYFKSGSFVGFSWLGFNFILFFFVKYFFVIYCGIKLILYVFMCWFGMRIYWVFVNCKICLSKRFVCFIISFVVNG